MRRHSSSPAARRGPARDASDSLLDTLLRKVYLLAGRSRAQAEGLNYFLDAALAAHDPRLTRVPRPRPLDASLDDEEAS